MKGESIGTLAMATMLLTTTSNAQEISCVQQKEVVQVDGTQFALNAYEIGGYNYFKLRDIGYLMRTSNAPFAIEWNAEENRIDIATGKAQDGEAPSMTPDTGKQTAVRTDAAVTVDAQPVSLDAYTSNDYTYFKLRDLGQALGFSVDWDAEKRQIAITTKGTDAPIAPWEYQKLLGRGVDVDWAGNTKGRLHYKEKAVKDFRAAGVSHVRIRVPDVVDEESFAKMDEVIEDCLENGLIPVLACGNSTFKTDPSEENLQKAVDWWKTMAERYKDKSHLLSFNLIIEVTEALSQKPDILNDFYERTVTEIRKTNPTRMLIIAPHGVSNPNNLAALNIPTQHNDYLMAEWHFYASGPSKKRENKLWTTGTDVEKQLILNKVNVALDWQKQTGIPTRVGAWMPGNYNKGNNYTVEEQVVFAKFMTQTLNDAKIPFAVNSDTKFYNRETGEWIAEMQLVFHAIFS